MIGAPRCGTTSLSEYLRAHREVFVSSPKEPNHFNDDYIGYRTTDRADYLRLFEAAGPQHRAVGEASPRYLHSTTAVSNILAFDPDARLIVMVRSPIELVPSLHALALHAHGEDVEDLAEAWRLQGRRREGRDVPSGCPDVNYLLYGDTARLGAQVRRVLDVVPRDQLHVVVFDDFVRDTAGAFARVLGFLGVAPQPGRTFERHNAGRDVRSRALLGTRRVAGAIKSAFGVKRNFGLLRHLLALNLRQTPRAPLSDALRRELAEEFRQDVELLSDLLARDLRHWVAGA